MLFFDRNLHQYLYIHNCVFITFTHNLRILHYSVMSLSRSVTMFLHISSQFSCMIIFARDCQIWFVTSWRTNFLPWQPILCWQHGKSSLVWWWLVREVRSFDDLRFEQNAFNDYSCSAVNEVAGGEVICLATGTKCISGEYLTDTASSHYLSLSFHFCIFGIMKSNTKNYTFWN